MRLFPQIRAMREFYPPRLQVFTARASQVSLIAPTPFTLAVGKQPEAIDSSTKERQFETPNEIKHGGCGCLSSLLRVLRWKVRAI